MVLSYIYSTQLEKSISKVEIKSFTNSTEFCDSKIRCLWNSDQNFGLKYLKQLALAIGRNVCLFLGQPGVDAPLHTMPIIFSSDRMFIRLSHHYMVVAHHIHAKRAQNPGHLFIMLT